MSTQLSKNTADYGSINISCEDFSKNTTSSSEESNHHSKNTCSVLETSSNIVTILTGAGMLTLPFVASLMGWSSIILLLVIASIFIYTYTLLAQAIQAIWLKYQQDEILSKVVVVDYFILGKEAFGNGGDRLVMVILFIEFLLAMISFFINIGCNLNVIFSHLTITNGILITSVISFILANCNIKWVTYFAVIGNSLTLLTVLSLFVSGVEINYQHSEFEIIEKDFQFLNITAIPFAVAIICFCYGGHGSFPRIFAHMAQPHRYQEAIFIAGCIVFTINVSILSVGYWIYGDSNEIIVTENIGRGLNGQLLPNGNYLRVAAAIGIIGNLQVTCPLILYSLRDLVHSAVPLTHTRASETAVTFLILIVAMVVALTCRSHLAGVYGLVGSCATLIDSIIFPLAFYHILVPNAGKNIRILIFHTILLVVCLLAGLSGLSSSVCSLVESVENGWYCSLFLPQTN